jgi:beta-glucosidase
MAGDRFVRRRRFIQAAPLAVLGLAGAAATRGGVFPPGFRWGAATSAHQVEGDNFNSDIWLLEHLRGGPFAEPSGRACDHFHRFGRDIAMLAGFGLDTYRFSIEWSRIEPREGEFSSRMLAHYRRMALACHEHGVMPVITFHHFTSPLWLAREGGWMEPRTADRFARFCAVVTRSLGDLIGMACTLNEPNQPAVGHILNGGQPVAGVAELLAAAATAAGSDRFSAYNFGDQMKMRDVMLAAHLRAVDVLKSGPGRFPVGITLALSDLQAMPGGEALRQRIFDETRLFWYQALGQDDFVGVQTYSRTRIGPDGEAPPPAGAMIDQMGLEYWPQALEATIREAARYAGRPVLITENGYATDDDAMRIRHIDASITAIRRCLADGIDIRGYIHWSLLDNFEWQLGYYPKYGLDAVDRQTMTRHPKPSAWHLGAIARASRQAP